MEYYGYAERNADSQVDWATIGKSMSDMLAETSRIREEKKSALEEKSRKYSEGLTKVPLGEHVGAREAALRFADNAAKYQLLQDRLLKQGALKLKDYTIARQNLIDGTEQAFTMYNNYQTQATEKMQRARESKSQKLELELMQQIQGWGSFNESDIYINPTNGALSIGKVTQQEIDGKTVRSMSTNPADFTTIANAQANLYANYDKFNYEDKLTSLAKSFGKEINAVRQYGSDKVAGSISTYLDIMKRTGKDKNGAITKFVDSETAAIKSMITNDFDRLSVLTEDIQTVDGVPYKFVYSEAETKGHPENIYIERKAGSGFTAPKLTAEQDEAVVEHLRKQIRLKYDKIEDIKTYTEPTTQKSEADYKSEENTKRKIESASLWNEVYYANTPEERKVALEAVLQSPFAQARGIKDIDFTSKPGFMIIKNDDPKLNSQPIDLNNVKNLGGWSRIGAAIHGITDKNIISKATGGGNPNLSKQIEYKELGRVSRGGSVEAEYKNYIESTTPELKTAISSGKSGSSTQELQSLYGDLGFKFKNNNPIIGNTIIITAPLKGEKGEKDNTITIDVSKKGKAELEIKRFISANLNPEKLDVLSKQGRFEAITAPKPTPTEEGVDEYGVPIK